MDERDFQLQKEILAEPKQVVITTHRSPDGDAIGSSVGLAILLKKMGHDVKIIVPNDYPGFLKWMDEFATIINHEKEKEEANNLTAHAQVIFCLDFNRYSRLEAYGEEVQKSDAIKILIDHHIDPTPDFDYSLSDTSSSSTAQLVFDYAISMDWEQYVDEEFARCIYAGIMTDTGSFRHSSTSKRTHEVVASLMGLGLSPGHVHQAIFDNNSYNRLRLTGYALYEKLEYIEDLNTAFISLTMEERNRFHYQRGDTEGLVNYGLSIKGVKLAGLFLEEQGFTKLSLRSIGEINVNRIAEQYFNGGGHKNAAGGRYNGTMEEALQKFRAVVTSMKNELEDHT